MNVRIKPHKLEGEVNIPPSKSLAHRAIIAASLAKGQSIIKNVSYSKDILATIDAMTKLGATIEKYDDHLIIYGTYPRRIGHIIDANESGSTLRFMIPIALLDSNPIDFLGHNKLIDRPLDIYFDMFDKHNIKYVKDKDHYLPLHVEGKLKSGIYELAGNVSSQFITGLLFALPLCNGDSKIIITTELESLGYINLTIDILKKFGIKISFENNEFIIPGNQVYKPYDYVVEGDYSQVAFWLEANMLGNNVVLKGISKDTQQGDREIIDDVIKIGANISYNDNKLTLMPKEFRNLDIDVSQTPDLGPALSAILTQVKGKSRLINAKRLRIKECDRITCVKEELNKLGCSLDETEDTLIINGKSIINGGVVNGHNDHRLVMAFAILASIAKEDVIIENASAVSKSYPDFFDVYESLGGIISYE